MKLPVNTYVKRCLLATMVAGACVTASAQSSLNHALKNGSFSLDTRTFYFNRSFDAKGVDDADALTFGGIMKYTSGDFNGASIGLGYYGNYSLFDIIDRVNDGGSNGTSLLQSNGDDISFLGEAYLKQNIGASTVTLGRQRLSTPLANSRDLRALPTSYEAVTLKNTGIADTLLEFGWIRSYTGFTSKLSGFIHNEGAWGEDGLGYLYGKTKFGDATVQGQYVKALEDSGSIDAMAYLDGKLPIQMGDKSYVKAQFSHTDHDAAGNRRNGKMYGIKGGTSFGPLDVALLYNKITDNTFRTVQSGAMYSDWQQGYGPYEPSDAVGIQAIYHPMANASIKLGYVDVNVDDDSRFTTDDFAEFNLDAKYKISDVSKIRLRYSIKDQTDSSTREDRDDFRLIYYHTFK